MGHTKRSQEFKERVDQVIRLLQFQVEDMAGTGTCTATLESAIEILQHNTTDSPCIVKAAENEPIFVLRAQDITAEEFVQRWALGLRTYVENHGAGPGRREALMAKWSDALQCAAEMREYPNRRRPD